MRIASRMRPEVRAFRVVPYGFHAAGDSLMTDYARVGTQTTAEFLAGATRLNTEAYANTAVPAAKITDQSASAAVNIDTRLTSTLSGHTKYLVFQCGINDVNNAATSATVKTRMDDFVSSRIAAGWQRVFVLTLTKASSITGDEETQRLAYNSALLASPPTGATVVDIASRDEFSQTSNATYFVDGVHYTTVGAEIVADMLSAAIQAFHHG